MWSQAYYSQSAFVLEVSIFFHSPCKYSRLKFPSVSLHLITMLIHAAKEVGPAMHIKHDSLALLTAVFPLRIVRPHLDPLRVQCTIVSSPLPPFAAANFVQTVVSQLNSESISCPAYCVLWYCDFVHPNPTWGRYPLGGKVLNIFDSVKGSVVEELTDEVQPLVVRDCNPESTFLFFSGRSATRNVMYHGRWASGGGAFD